MILGFKGVISVVFLVMICDSLFIGVRFYFHPEKLCRDSWRYRRWLLDWQVRTRRSGKTIHALSDKRIQYYALHSIIAGLVLILGLVAMWLAGV